MQTDTGFATGFVLGDYESIFTTVSRPPEPPVMSPETQLNACYLIQVLWLFIAIWWLIRRRDEVPLVISGVLFYVFSFRLWAVLQGLSAPVDITPFGFEPMTFADAVGALDIAVLGQTVLLGTYLLTQNRQLSRGAITAPANLLQWMRPRVFLLAAVAIPVTLLAERITQGESDSGKIMAFEISAYLYEFPFILVSVAILLALLWKSGGLPVLKDRVAAVAIVGAVAYLTFGPYGRFQFLGWLLAVTIIAMSGDNTGKRLTKMALGFSAAIALFAFAGALRNSENEGALQEDAWARFAFAEDANMLDGLVLLQRVYPAMLPYTYGGGHFEILARPIPRAWWPDKPVGGYMNKLGLTAVETGFTLGISPGLVGSFYSEGGPLAVVFFSALYGYGIGRLIRWSEEVAPIAGALLRAICCASLIPLLRGGDLPGIYAWLFMSFWPCLLLMWLRRRDLFPQRARVPFRRPDPPPKPAPTLPARLGP